MHKYILHFIIIGVLFGQENTYLKFIGQWGEFSGNCKAVSARGDTVFFAEGKGFKTVDYSEKDNPILKSQLILPYSNISCIEIENKYAYLLAKTKLIIIDINDLSNPSLIGQYEINNGKSMVLKDEFLFLVYGYYEGYHGDYCHGGFIIFDVTDPVSINEIYHYKANYQMYDLAINDTTAYLTVKDSISIFNIANPNLPIKVAQFEFESYESSICIAGNFAYVVDRYFGLNVFDIEDPYQMNTIGNLDVNGDYVIHSNNYLFLSQYYKVSGYPDDIKVVTIDVTTPSNPIQISEINLGDFGFAKSLDYSNNYLYVSHGSSGLYVIDVSSITDPKEITRYKTGYSHDIAINDNYAYLASGFDGVQIINISDEKNPFLFGRIDLKDHPTDRTNRVSIENNILYIKVDRFHGDFVNSIFMIDISIPASPKILGSFDTNLMMDIEVKNDTIYLTGIYDFCIIDVTNPENPILINTLAKGGGLGYDLVLYNNCAFIGDWHTGLRIIDISDPANLYELVNYDAYCAGHISVNQNYVYLIAQSKIEAEYSLRVLDISNITSIKELGYINLKSHAKGIAFKNGIVYVGDDLRIIDVSDPENLRELEYYNTAGKVNEIVLRNGYIFIADGPDGLYIFQYDKVGSITGNDNFNPYSINLFQNYPNPFNSKTSIAFELSHPMFVNLSIYNIEGKLIRELINENLSSGYHTIKWEAEGKSSGIFFYVIKTESRTITKRLLLIK
jgi:hypothetical protein